MSVAVLFARRDSVYKTLPDVDVWDEDRDALRWLGGCPVVAHPPCRAWGRLRQFAKPAPHEKDLARYAVAMIRMFGGVLEHPAYSTLWADQGLPKPGEGYDEYGGWTLPVVQHWWGHKAEKATWLYIVGVAKRQVPDIPMVMQEATHVIKSSRHNHGRDVLARPCVTKAEREATPPEFARWLVDLASRCRVKEPA